MQLVDDEVKTPPPTATLFPDQKGREIGGEEVALPSLLLSNKI